jgi:hypothetical protein
LDIVIAHLPAFACAAAMVVCLRMMGRHHQATMDEAAQRELSELRRRVAELEREPTATPTEEITYG